jgi:predicted ATPase
MIRLIEALNYRCLRYVRQPLGPFHVLVGPNASGKSTFLDVPDFIYTMFQSGLDAAIKYRTDNILDLFWQGPESECFGNPAQNHFELAIELALPDVLAADGKQAVRYCVAIGLDQAHNAGGILKEEVRILGPNDGPTPCSADTMPSTIFYNQGKLIFPDPSLHHRLENGMLRDTFFRQIMAIIFRPNDLPYIQSFMQMFPSLVVLQSAALRDPSPPRVGMRTRWSGDGLPNMVEHLQKYGDDKWRYWQDHLRTVFPELDSVQLHLRQEDKKRYIALRMKNGVEFPSWLLSEGTLHLLALTILAFLPQNESSIGGRTWMIEEPESHLHPLNIEAVMQSLSSVYDVQILMTTHAPIVLTMTDINKLLVFARDNQRGVRIVRGDQHLQLRDWKGDVDLGTLFAGGVLG